MKYGKKLKTIFLGLVLLTSACVSVNGCAGFKPIRPEPHDLVCISDSLADQILIHNEYGQKVFGWKP